MRGIKINNTLHTGEDLGLVMIAKELPAPKVQTYNVAVPGRNGLLDLSEALTGEVAYDNRILKFTFLGDGSREYVLSLIDKFLTYHGQYITVTTDDYPEWYYTGRADVTYTDKGFYTEITITLDAQPFRYKLKPKSYSFDAPSNQSIALLNEGRPVIPIVMTSAETVLVNGDTTYNLGVGTFDLEDVKLLTGKNTLTITSEGTVTITYRERAI